MNKDVIESALKTINYPGFSRDIVSFGLVRDIAFSQGTATISLEVTSSDPTIPGQLKKAIEETVGPVDGVTQVDAKIIFKKSAPPANSGSGHVAGPSAKQIDGIKHIIAVASGKGGVGKSTVATNLACALDQRLSAQGKTRSVGLMDCDIYGPSIPMMLGINRRPDIEGDRIVPIENFDVRVMSMGFLVDEDTPVVWRGPMIMKTIQQFAANVAWGDLEVLVVDLPPGTGDAQLSLVQTLPLKGAVIVTTPQTVATNVTKRGAKMFEKVNVPLLGVVENMAYLEMPDGEKNYIFGENGGQDTAHALETELLGQIPLEKEIRMGSDQGIPIVISHPESNSSATFKQVAQDLLKKLE